MAMSGVQLHADCLPAHNEIKLKKTYKFIFFKVDKEPGTETNMVMVDEKFKTTGDEEKDWENFVGQLKDDTPTYCVYDFHFVNKENQEKKILLFIAWCSDTAPVKKRMVFASTKDVITKALDMNNKKHVLQANELGDLDRDELIKEFSL